MIAPVNPVISSFDFSILSLGACWRLLQHPIPFGSSSTSHWFCWANSLKVKVNFGRRDTVFHVTRSFDRYRWIWTLALYTLQKPQIMKNWTYQLKPRITVLLCPELPTAVKLATLLHFAIGASISAHPWQGCAQKLYRISPTPNFGRKFPSSRYKS